MSSKKRILVTGGLGYVGGRIVQGFLNSNDCEVYVSSRSLIRPNAFKNVESLVMLDSKDVFSLENPFKFSFDCIVHLAACNEIDCAKFPIESAEFNIIESLKLLQKAIASKCAKFIYFSTAHIYGSPLQGFINEERLPRPQHPYAISHKAFEDYLLAARDKKEIEGIVLRMSNSFGAPLSKEVNRWSLLINDLCKQAVLSNSLIIKSSGKQQRDFIALTDVVNATLFFTDLDSDKTLDGLFNLGGNFSASILKIATMIKERAKYTLNRDVDIDVQGSDIYENNKELVFSSEKLHKIGFNWQKNMIEEIDNLLIFCQNHFNIQK